MIRYVTAFIAIVLLPLVGGEGIFAFGEEGHAAPAEHAVTAESHAPDSHAVEAAPPAVEAKPEVKAEVKAVEPEHAATQAPAVAESAAVEHKSETSVTETHAAKPAVEGAHGESVAAPVAAEVVAEVTAEAPVAEAQSTEGDPAAAGEERALPGGKDNVDVVLLLDASGSMRRTDPLRLRDQGAKLLTQFLKPGDRLAVIEFANEVKTIRPLAPYTLAQADEVARQIAEAGDSGIYTDLMAGLKAGRSALENSRRDDVDKVIVLMSDGQMEPDPAVASSLAQLDELNETFLPGVRDSNIKIHTLALSELSDRKLLQHIAQQANGVSVYAPTAEEIHGSFAELFMAVKKPQVLTMTSKGFPIDQGIREATFYINRTGTKDIKVRTPSGVAIDSTTSAENIKWYRSDKFDVVTIDDPEVGDWVVDGLPQSESFATVLTNVQLKTDFPAGMINSGDDVVLQARFYESKKPVSLPELTGVVDYTYEVIPTDKVSEPIQRALLHDDGKAGDRRADDGIFSARVNIEEEGEYRLTVTAKAPTFVRQQQVPFRVKPRLVLLTVESHAVEEPIAHGKGDAEAKEEEGGGAGTTSAEEPALADFFTIKLSEDTNILKEKRVQLLAKDVERKLYNLPLKQSLTDKLLFEVKTSMLPKEGEYELEATLRGEGKRREKIAAASNKLLYRFTLKTDEDHVQVVEVVTEKKEKVPPLWPSLLLMTGINLIFGFMLISRTQKSVAGMSVVMTSYEPPKQIIAVLNGLKQKMELVELDPSDPVFAPANIAKLRDRKALNLNQSGDAPPGDVAPTEGAADASAEAAGSESPAPAESEQVPADQVEQATESATDGATENAAENTPENTEQADADAPPTEEKGE